MRESQRGLQHPRTTTPGGGAGTGFHWGDLPPERQQAAEKTMAGIGSRQGVTKLRGWMGAAHEEVAGKIGKLEASKQGVPAPLRAQGETLGKARESLRGVRSIDTSMDAAVERVVGLGMAPIKAEREHFARTGEMRATAAGDFYPGRAKIAKRIAEGSLGRGTPEAMNMEKAAGFLSARTSPLKELEGAAGMAALIRESPDIGVSLTHGAAKYLSTQVKDVKSEVTRTGAPVPHGTFSLESLSRSHPNAAALMIQHGVMQAGLITSKNAPEEMSASKQGRDIAMAKGARLHLPEGLHLPAAAFVGSLGASGFPKGGKAIRNYYEDPSEYGGGAGGSDVHKLLSYGFNNMMAGDPMIQQATHHYMGAVTHGDKWFAANPQAEGVLRKAANHPAWNDVTSTIDAWSGRAVTALPFHAAMALGKYTTPEEVMKFGGMGGEMNRKGVPLGNAKDLGYLYGEEVHRRAGQHPEMSVNLPGGGRVSAPGHVIQSSAWYGIQAEAYAGKMASGEKSLAPPSLSHPSSLNRLVAPRMFH